MSEREEPEAEGVRESTEGAEEPRASEILGAAIETAARRAGLDPDADQTTGQMVWQVIGGWRGILESVLPLLVFIVAYSTTRELLLSLALSVGTAALFTIVRLLMKSPPVAALGGLVAAVFAAAGLPLIHIPVQHAYNAQELAEQLSREAKLSRLDAGAQSAAAPPCCPRCGSEMELGVERGGILVWMCTNFPCCRAVQPYEPAARRARA